VVDFTAEQETSNVAAAIVHSTRGGVFMGKGVRKNYHDPPFCPCKDWEIPWQMCHLAGLVISGPLRAFLWPAIRTRAETHA
jgi:hypothetical protein